MSTPNYAIGIDLGTTNSCVALFNNRDKTIEVCTNALGKTTTPSWIGFAANGNITVGERARTKKTWLYDMKRAIGKNFSDETVQELNRKTDFTLAEGDNSRVVVNIPGQDKPLEIQEVSAQVLTTMKKIAEEKAGEQITDAVITVPAYFNSQQK